MDNLDVQIKLLLYTIGYYIQSATWVNATIASEGPQTPDRKYFFHVGTHVTPGNFFSLDRTKQS